MATCSQSIAAMGSYASLEELLPNTLTPFSVTAVTNKLFKLTCPVVQTAQFSISVSSVPVTLTLTFYRWNGSTATPIGAVNITTSASTVYVDFQEGDYIVCVRSSGGNQSGTLTAQFTEYEQQIRLAAVAHVGETMSVTLADPDRPPVACDEALYRCRHCGRICRRQRGGIFDATWFLAFSQGPQRAGAREHLHRSAPFVAPGGAHRHRAD